MQDGITTSYTYDALGQLIRVVDGQEGATWEYTYDQGGNILSKKKYALGVASGTVSESKNFTYGNANWRDQLTAVNGVGITYDAIGNPLNDGTWTYTWQNGRQLKKMQKSGETVEFIYNENGLRVQKTATSTGVTKYTLHGKNIVHMTQGSNELHFFYDAQNKPAVVVYNGTPYTYVKNLQGDIVAILDSNKNVVVSYVYDAWGRPISCLGTMANTLGKINPFRYRGYVYDEETGLYYLMSRYYNSSLCRFIIVDKYAAIGQGTLGQNAFAYCLNDPVSMRDKDGRLGLFALCTIGALVGGIIDYAGQVISNYADGKTGKEAWVDEVDWGSVAGSAFSGAVSAVPGGAVWGEAIDAVGSNVIAAGVNYIVEGEEINVRKLGEDIVTDFVESAIAPDFLPTNDVPKYIRDIKREAREQGVKGTKNLLKYLDRKQVTTIVDNAINGTLSEQLCDEFAEASIFN